MYFNAEHFVSHDHSLRTLLIALITEHKYVLTGDGQKISAMAYGCNFHCLPLCLTSKYCSKMLLCHRDVIKIKAPAAANLFEVDVPKRA